MIARGAGGAGHVEWDLHFPGKDGDAKFLAAATADFTLRAELHLETLKLMKERAGRKSRPEGQIVSISFVPANPLPGLVKKISSSSEFRDMDIWVISSWGRDCRYLFCHTADQELRPVVIEAPIDSLVMWPIKDLLEGQHAPEHGPITRI